MKGGGGQRGAIRSREYKGREGMIGVEGGEREEQKEEER